MRKRFWKGLRTIDIVIGLSTICMVVAVIAFRYDDFKCRAMQSEAKFSLQEVFAAQQLFFAEHDRYATITELVSTENRVVLPQKNYILTDLFRPTNENFVIVAKGAPGSMVAGEEWTIDQTNDLRLRKAVCDK